MDLGKWAERVFAVVELDGATTQRVRLVGTDDGSVWQSWYRPFPEPDDFVREVEAMVRTIENEGPARRIELAVLAEGRNGEVLNQLPMHVTGKAKLGRGDQGAAAQAMVMDSLAGTVEKIQRLSNSSVDSARLQLEAATQVIAQQVELVNAYRLRELEEPAPREPTPVEQVFAEQMPQLISMANLLLEHAIQKVK